MYWMRALIVYPLTILLFRLLGRTLNFQSRPYDTAVQVLLGSASANLILTEDIPVWRAFTALGTLALLHMAISYLSLWNRAKKFLVGEPVFVIENGQILQANLVHQQISVEELSAALREKGYHNLADIEFAILEASGKLSVIPKSQARPVTPKDLNLATSYEGYTTLLIADGRIDRQNLTKVKLTEAWLESELSRHGVTATDQVLFASLDTQGQLFVVRKQDVPFLRAIFKGVQAQTDPGLPPMMGPQQPH